MRANNTRIITSTNFIILKRDNLTMDEINNLLV